MGGRTPREQAKRERAYREWPPELRHRYQAERARVDKALGAGAGREHAWSVVSRLWAWARRRGDAKACARCPGLVLWRREGHRSVAVDEDGAEHTCGAGR